MSLQHPVNPDTSSDQPPSLGLDHEAEEKKLLRKLDSTILPLFTFIYTLINTDRSSIGNAQVAGMRKDLALKNYDLSIALTVLFIGYGICKIPSNLIAKRFGSVWIAFLVTGAGSVSLGTAFVTSFSGLVLTRAFLATCEGGIGGGLIYILSRYYRRQELVLRLAVFFGLSPILAGAFAGLLSYGLLSVPDMGIIQSWRKIFFVEGIITIGTGVLGLAFLPDDPINTKFLTANERALAIMRIDADSILKTHGMKEKTTLRLVIRSFSIWTCVCILSFMLLNISYQGMNVFLPTIINELGHLSKKETQLRTVPVYLSGACWMLISSYASFRWRNRTVPILFAAGLHIIGYSIAVLTSGFKIRYIGCIIAYMGDCAMGVLFMTWASDNAAPDTMRAVVTAAIPGIGVIGAIIGMWIFVPSDGPDFRHGNLLNLAAGVTILVITALGFLYLKNENGRRDRGERNERLSGKGEKEIRNLGYRHPNFRYQV